MEPNGEQPKKETIPEREEKILHFWKEQNIFEKSLAQTEGNDPYVFYDGPPFATGLPHYGHLLAGTIKDVVPRYQTMRGRYVRREWGWDCHGLPIENLIEKELGFNSKKDIETYGIGKFNQKARESVLTYDKEWRQIVPRMGRWVDMDREYKTMDASYTDSIWWAFKTLYDKKLIYEGFKSMHVCPRCETTLAASEVAQGYKDVKDISVYVKFELVDEPGTYFVAWTTTPWTLPGNVALAVGADIPYSIFHIPSSKERYIVAKDRLLALVTIAKDYEIEGEILGKDLVGKSYKPVFDDYAKDEALENRENGWKVYAADFVTTESGTGIVHIAPAFGEDDMELGKKMKLPFVQHVGMDGVIKDKVKGFAGLHVKPKSDDDKVRLGTDIAILKYLQENGYFFAKENIQHAYPHCWRCDTPLLNYAASSWFVNVTALKPRLIEENKEINWIPEHMKEGRFGKWLEGARDWAISRSRYWGAPIPAWKCNKCDNVEIFGGIEELKAKLASGNAYYVLRHGESEANAHNIVSYKPEDNYPLTERGRTQVSTAATKLKNKGIDLIIASPVMRTKETAAIIAETLGISATEIVYDARIAEVNTGDFNGCPIEDYRTYFIDTLEKFTKCPPNGETLEEMKSRVAEFLYETDAKYRGKTILFVTHEYTTWMMESAAKGATNEEASWIKLEGGDDFIDNGEVREFHFVPLPHNDKYELDFHRPFIDEHTTYKCSCGLGTMSRVLDVFDCWFESGSMPFAQFHYMGDERTPEGKLFAKNFPADFIAEGIDQTRGWFYTMLILATGLFDRAPYKSVIVNGLILAEDGQKMSKKLKNYPDPMEVVSKYGADALRFYLVSSPAVRGEELRFAIAGVDEIFKKMTMRIDNVRSFYEMYAGENIVPREVPKSTNVLDRWILARWYEMHAEVTHHLDTHELDKATRPIMPFVDDLSTWYLRRSRDRFKSDDLTDRAAAVATTGWTLLQLAKLIAPFMPFLADDMYRRLRVENKKESVHLENWPPMGIAPSTILEDMEEVRRIVTLALELRAKAGIKVRQPLSALNIPESSLKNKDEFLAIIADEVNVKNVERTTVKTAEHISSGDILLDMTITPELKEEGQLRDLIRHVQELRKTSSLVPDDKITLFASGDESLCALLKKNEAELAKTTNIVQFAFEEHEGGVEIKIDGATLYIAIAKA
jgi:isoleucyl-tRNA synthetase